MQRPELDLLDVVSEIVGTFDYYLDHDLKDIPMELCYEALRKELETSEIYRKVAKIVKA